MSLLTRLAFTTTFLLTLASAQTFTSCNPLNSTNCPIDNALGTNHTWDFTTGQADTTSWNVTDGTISYGTNGAEFTISKKGDAPTIQTNFYVFGGEIETWLKAAPGQGEHHFGLFPQGQMTDNVQVSFPAVFFNRMTSMKSIGSSLGPIPPLQKPITTAKAIQLMRSRAQNGSLQPILQLTFTTTLCAGRMRVSTG